MTGAAPRRRNNALAMFLALVALLEILVVAAIVFWIRSGAPCDGGVSALPPALLSVLGGHRAGNAPAASGAAAAEGAAAPGPGDNAQSAGTVHSVGTAGADGNGGAAAGSAAGGSAQANGDLNQVPDPNCVGKTAAGLLNSDQQAKPQATCGAFKAPSELKAAAAQVQNGIGTTGTTPSSAAAPGAASSSAR